MILPGRTVAVLLCAGLSSRFGQDNKLLAPLAGQPVVAHSARTLAALPLLRRIAVVPPRAVALGKLLEPAFDLIVNPEPEQGQDRSLRIGLRAAQEFDPDGVLVGLGDMPFVTAGHIANLLNTADPCHGAVSQTEEYRSPPLILPIALVRAILAGPDQPVRDQLRQACAYSVVAPPALLRDIDTLDDLAAVTGGTD